MARRGPRLRAIQDQTKSRVAIRGRGSGHVEPSTGQEAATPLMVGIAAEGQNLQGFLSGVKQILDLLNRTKSEYIRHCEETGCEPRHPAFTVGPLPGGTWDESMELLKGELPPRHSQTA